MRFTETRRPLPRGGSTRICVSSIASMGKNYNNIRPSRGATEFEPTLYRPHAHMHISRVVSNKPKFVHLRFVQSSSRSLVLSFSLSFSLHPPSPHFLSLIRSSSALFMIDVSHLHVGAGLRSRGALHRLRVLVYLKASRAPIVKIYIYKYTVLACVNTNTALQNR